MSGSERTFLHVHLRISAQFQAIVHLLTGLHSLAITSTWWAAQSLIHIKQDRMEPKYKLHKQERFESCAFTCPVFCPNRTCLCPEHLKAILLQGCIFFCFRAPSCIRAKANKCMPHVLVLHHRTVQVAHVGALARAIAHAGVRLCFMDIRVS